MQIIGALCLLEGSNAPALAVATEHWTAALLLQGTDWLTLAQSAARLPFTISDDQSGPDHARTFTVTVTDQAGRAAHATGTSKKAARHAAFERWIYAHARRLVPVASTGSAVRRPQGIAGLPASVQRHIVTLRRDLELPTSFEPLLTQALMHPSWSHENPGKVNGAAQSPYETLAVEGSHVLHALRAHQLVSEILDGTATPTADQARVLSSTEKEVAKLAERFGLPGRVLLGRGQEHKGSSDRILSDAAQAVVAVAWRARPGLLTRQHPRALADWLKESDTRLDAVTILRDRVLAPLGLGHEIAWREEGAEHDTQFQATWIWANGQTCWRGPWRSSKAKAKQAAAGEVIDILVEHLDGVLEDPTTEEAAVIASVVRAASETAIDSSLHDRRRSAAGSTLAVRSVLSGETSDQTRWAERTINAMTIAGLSSSTIRDASNRARVTYGAALVEQRHRAVAAYVRAERDRLLAGDNWLEPVAALLSLSDLLDVFTADCPQVMSVVKTWAGADRVECADESRREDAELRRMMPGAADLVSHLRGQVLQVATESNATLESAIMVRAREVTLTMRVPGIDLTQTLGRSIGALAALVPGVRIENGRGAVAVTLPTVATPANAFAAAAFDALSASCEDPALVELRKHLDDLLEVVTRPHRPALATELVARASSALAALEVR